MLHVTNAKYVRDYQVEVTFDNGRTGIVDLYEALRGPVFEALKDKSKFSQLKVDKDLETIVWSNGADLAPEYIYFHAFKNEEDLHKTFRKWGYLS